MSNELIHGLRMNSCRLKYTRATSLVKLSGGLDADTLGALGDVQELNEALDIAIDSSNPAVGDFRIVQ